jgi:hypothetical protein
MRRYAWILALPLMMGAKGQGCAVSSTDPAPDVAGTWGVSYADTMEIDVTIGGAVYSKSLPSGGGLFSITHNGQPFMFNVDCSRPDVICPSEVWPNSVSIDQHDPAYPHRMWVQIPTQSCSGQLVQPQPSECGQGTLNPDCKPVCNGDVTTSSEDAFGVIAEDGSSFDLLLGAGVATNGKNCALLGLSWAHATLDNSGSATVPADWNSHAMSDGTVETAYAGGCVWVSDPNMSQDQQALVLAATVEIKNGFSANKTSSAVSSSSDGGAHD